MDSSPSSSQTLPGSDRPWYTHLNKYHWYVFVVAALGWLFDTMDQRIFVMSRQSAMTDLLGFKQQGKDILLKDGTKLDKEESERAKDKIKQFGLYATTVFMLGWATGGLYFGIMGDRWGRARTMLITILLYSFFTGLSALSRGPFDFMIYRFLTGLGVGGEFAAGIALVAEVMPAAARANALGLLQALSAVGNIIGSLTSGFVLPLDGGWKYMFLIGTLPALLVVMVRRSLKEPETWQKASQSTSAELEHELGSLRSLFSDARWRRHAVVGFMLALSGVIGLWAVGFCTPELINEVVPAERANVARTAGTILQDIGAFFGIYLFGTLANRFGRRVAFTFSFTIAWLSVVLVFGFLQNEGHVYWMLPLMGFSIFSVFGGFAIYFPELFPTRLRSTGTGFCYNAARFIAAAGPYTLAELVPIYRKSAPTLLSSLGATDSPFRYAALTVAFIYFIGLATIWFAPETKGKPLPE